MRYINIFQQKYTKSSDFYESTKSQHRAYADKHKLIRVPYSLRGGKDRPLHGDFFSHVLYAPSVLPGVHRIQQAKAEYMHRFREAIRTPAHFVPTLRKHGATPMLTAIKGESRPHPGQLRLPAFTVPAENLFQFPESDLDYITTPNGVLVTYTGLMVAWIYQGHAGSRSTPGACQFYDVAYPSLTFGQQNRITGVMLDSDSFESLVEAVQFVEATFANGGEV